jgi:ABC-type nitrate/sulfonate/bicarbonate transport system substrate-binding protein
MRRLRGLRWGERQIDQSAYLDPSPWNGQGIRRGGIVTTYRTLTFPSAPYADYDDCLAAVAADYVDDHPEAEGYDLSARWADDDREAVEIDVPVFDRTDGSKPRQ